MEAVTVSFHHNLNAEIQLNFCHVVLPGRESILYLLLPMALHTFAGGGNCLAWSRTLLNGFMNKVTSKETLILNQWEVDRVVDNSVWLFDFNWFSLWKAISEFQFALMVFLHSIFVAEVIQIKCITQYHRDQRKNYFFYSHRHRASEFIIFLVYFTKDVFSQCPCHYIIVIIS